MKINFPTINTAKIIQQWGNVNYRMYPGGRHMGIDIMGRVGTAIYSACDGIVEVVNLQGAHGYGRYVIINHGDFKTLYAHLHKVEVNEADSVTAGKQIALMGGDPTDNDRIDGASTGPHLHFEVILSEPPSYDFVKTSLGYTVDPFKYLLNLSDVKSLWSGDVVAVDGIRVRSTTDATKASNVIGTLFYRKEKVFITELREAGGYQWGKLYSLRDEWAAISSTGPKAKEYIKLEKIKEVYEPYIMLVNKDAVVDGYYFSPEFFRALLHDIEEGGLFKLEKRTDKRIVISRIQNEVPYD